MSQFALPLDWPAGETDADFIVSDSNAVAVRHLEHVSTWPVWATLLAGPRKSGRSLLGRIFASKTGGMLIDNAENQAEDRIFHAWNIAQEIRRPLLIIVDHAPPVWQPELLDLRSRLAATPAIRLGDPDDRLIDMLLEHMLGARGIMTKPEFRSFVVSRIERSFIAVQRFVDMVDQAALAQRIQISRTLARKILCDMGVIDESLF